jgi:hypothetical protein
VFLAARAHASPDQSQCQFRLPRTAQPHLTTSNHIELRDKGAISFKKRWQQDKKVRRDKKKKKKSVEQRSHSNRPPLQGLNRSDRGTKGSFFVHTLQSAIVSRLTGSQSGGQSQDKGQKRHLVLFEYWLNYVFNSVHKVTALQFFIFFLFFISWE